MLNLSCEQVSKLAYNNTSKFKSLLLVRTHFLLTEPSIHFFLFLLLTWLKTLFKFEEKETRVRSENSN